MFFYILIRRTFLAKAILLILLFVLEAHVNGSVSKNNRHNLIIVLYGTELTAWSAIHSELLTFYCHPAKLESGFGWGGDNLIFLGRTVGP